MCCFVNIKGLVPHSCSICAHGLILSGKHRSKYLISTVLCLVAQLCPTLGDTMNCSPPGSSVYGDSPGKNTRVGYHDLLQGIFPTQGWNPSLLHWRQILYCLSHQGISRILEWVAYTFSWGSSQPRNWTEVSCIAGGFFTSWAPREALVSTTFFILWEGHSWFACISKQTKRQNLPKKVRLKKILFPYWENFYTCKSQN